jgi:hypothetical protein
MSAPDLSSLSPEITDLGLLIGLLTGTASSPDFNANWFSNPVTGFESGFNWPNLQPVIAQVLPASENVLPINTGVLNENWYSIQITDDKGVPQDSGFYFVEKTVGDNALLGVGTQYAFTETVAGVEIVVQPFAFLPVFTMPNTAGATPIFNIDTNGPVEIGVEVTLSGGTFTQSGTAYTGLIFVASFNFTTTEPTLTFMLRDQNGNYQDASTVNLAAVLNTVLGLPPVVNFLNDNVLPESSPVNFTWGTLFNVCGWLTTDASPYTVVSPINIPTTAGGLEDYIVATLFSAISKFLGQNSTITLISEAGTATTPAWSVNLALNNGRYGINVQVTNIEIGTSPQINIQIGAPTNDGTDWIKQAGGNAQVGAGLSFYLLSGPVTDLQFDPGFELINVGFDILNTNSQPLFNVNGVAVNEAQLRGFFSTLQNDAWGVAVAIDGISLPLTPPSGGSSTSVPATLMSAASAGGGSGDPKQPVNPEFSFLAAYVSSFYFQLFDQDNKPENIIVMPIQKSFGPVELKDIGIGWDNTSMQLLFQLDGSLNLNALNIELDKLTIGIPVETPATLSAYSFDLDGMGISFASSAVTITGDFLKDTTSNPVEYNGAVSIQVASWGITVLGSFASLNGSPSLFIFGVLDAELGGPPFFFITGAAVGFGYNRQIIMPTIDNVVNFPFVQAANNPALFSGQSTNDVLTSMSTYIPPQLGEYWLAAGVKFTSFELLNSFALLIIQFGKNFEVDLLGTSTLQLPKAGEGATYVYAELELEVIFDPSQGVIEALAQLTSNSYVISQSCVLSGGFAFYSWFSPSPNAGDFVVTIGGYNAAFTPPSYYPTVPRLGFNWNVSDQITFAGNAYFALTPSCVMAGGKLSLTYSDGNLNAWFDAWADFLISWKPFHYDISIGLSIGVSYRLDLLFVHTTISVSLGISVEIYGPDFGGTAYVAFYIVSFTVSFGAGQNAPAAVDWADFQSYFLPQTSGGSQSSFMQFATTDLIAGDTATTPLVIKINTSAGLNATFVNGNNNTVWIVAPSSFAFNTDSGIPASQVTFGGPNPPAPIAANPFGVKPVGSMTISGDASTHNLTVSKMNDKGVYEPYPIGNWVLSTAPKNVPNALWGTVNTGAETPSANSVPDITSGLSWAGPPPTTMTGPPSFPIPVFDFTNIDTYQTLSVSQNTATAITLSTDGSIASIQSTLYNTQNNANTCTDLFNGLQDIGSLANQNDSLQAMVQQADDIFNGSPMLAPSGGIYADADISFKRNNIHRKRQTIRSGAPKQAEKNVHALAAEIFNYRFGTDTASAIVFANLISKSSGCKAVTRPQQHDQSPAGAFGMQPGQIQVWQLAAVDAGDKLTYDGVLPLRVIFFDKNIEIISNELMPQGGAGSLTLPVNAAHLVISAMEAESPGGLLGWHAASKLALLNPKYLMGRGCLIRPQMAQRTGRKQFTYATGLSGGDRLVLKNSTRKPDAPVVFGWTETLFSASVKEVFVTGRMLWEGQEIPADPFNVRLIYQDATGKKHAAPLNKAAEGTAGLEFWHQFTIPAGIAAGDFSVSVKAGDDVAVYAVAGAEEGMPAFGEESYGQLKQHEAALGYSNRHHRTQLILDKTIL